MGRPVMVSFERRRSVTFTTNLFLSLAGFVLYALKHFELDGLQEMGCDFG